jgi:hypothetical protein
MQLKVKNRKFAYAGSILKSAPGITSGYFHYQKKDIIQENLYYLS